MSDGRRIYTHARQFPHLAGRTDAEIRSLVRSALLNRLWLIRIMRLRNAGVVLGMVLAAWIMQRWTSLPTGTVLVIVGGAATLFVLCWNLVWVNTVVYRLTRPEGAD